MKNSFFVLLCGLLLCTAAPKASAVELNGQWVQVNAGESIPGNAIRTGDESGKSRYICIYDYQGASIPGKVVDLHCNFVGADGPHTMVPPFKVLVSDSTRKPLWGAPSADMSNAFSAGAENTGEVLYVCKPWKVPLVHVGKYRPAYGECRYELGGLAGQDNQFDVLLTKSAGIACGNPLKPPGPELGCSCTCHKYGTFGPPVACPGYYGPVRCRDSLSCEAYCQNQWPDSTPGN